MDVPCNLLTGFLGSGKTTLLRHVLENGLGRRRVAILMNELGDVGIDGQVVRDLDGVEAMVELNSGCVCCSIGEYQFATAYQRVIDEVHPDLVIVETTGVADPGPILERLALLGTKCDAVITVVDAATFAEQAARHAVLDAQVREADFLVLNKSDLVDESDLERLASRLRRANPRAALLRTEHGRVPMELLFAVGAAPLRSRAGAGRRQSSARSTGDPDLEVVTCRLSENLDLPAFRRFLAGLPESVYRAKGVLGRGTGAPLLFNFVCGRVELQPLPALRAAGLGTQAVFIGPGLQSVRKRILADLRACEAA